MSRSFKWTAILLASGLIAYDAQAASCNNTARPPTNCPLDHALPANTTVPVSYLLKSSWPKEYLQCSKEHQECYSSRFACKKRCDDLFIECALKTCVTLKASNNCATSWHWNGTYVQNLHIHTAADFSCAQWAIRQAMSQRHCHKPRKTCSSNYGNHTAPATNSTIKPNPSSSSSPQYYDTSSNVTYSNQPIGKLNPTPTSSSLAVTVTPSSTPSVSNSPSPASSPNDDGSDLVNGATPDGTESSPSNNAGGRPIPLILPVNSPAGKPVSSSPSNPPSTGSNFGQEATPANTNAGPSNSENDSKFRIIHPPNSPNSNGNQNATPFTGRPASGSPPANKLEPNPASIPTRNVLINPLRDDIPNNSPLSSPSSSSSPPSLNTSPPSTPADLNTSSNPSSVDNKNNNDGGSNNSNGNGNNGSGNSGNNGSGNSGNNGSSNSGNNGSGNNGNSNSNGNSGNSGSSGDNFAQQATPSNTNSGPSNPLKTLPDITIIAPPAADRSSGGNNNAPSTSAVKDAVNGSSNNAVNRVENQPQGSSLAISSVDDDGSDLVKGATPDSKASRPGNDVKAPTVRNVISPETSGDGSKQGSIFKPPTSDADSAAPVPDFPPLTTSPEPFVNKPIPISITPPPQTTSSAPAPNFAQQATPKDTRAGPANSEFPSARTGETKNESNKQKNPPAPSPSSGSNFAQDATPKDTKAGPVNAQPTTVPPPAAARPSPSPSASSPAPGPNFAQDATPEDMKAGPVNAQPTTVPPPAAARPSPSPSASPAPNFAQQATPKDTKAGPTNSHFPTPPTEETKDESNKPKNPPAPAPSPVTNFATDATPKDIKAGPINGRPDNHLAISPPGTPRPINVPPIVFKPQPAADSTPQSSPAPVPASKATFAQEATPTTTRAGPSNGQQPSANKEINHGASKPASQATRAEAKPVTRAEEKPVTRPEEKPVTLKSRDFEDESDFSKDATPPNAHASAPSNPIAPFTIL